MIGLWSCSNSVMLTEKMCFSQEEKGRKQKEQEGRACGGSERFPMANCTAL